MSRLITLGFALATTCALTCAQSFAQSDTAASQVGQQVLATYGQDKITFEEFAKQQPAVVSWLGVGVTPEQIQQTLEAMILSNVAAREADVTGLSKDPDVKAQVDKILAAAYLKKRVPKEKIQVEEADLKARYEADRDKYKSQELVKVSHILVKSLDEANKISGAIEKGAKFSDESAKHSIDPLSAKDDGLLGLTPPNQLLPELRAAIQDLTPGQLSKPIKTSLGYHLLRLEDRPQVTYRPFEELRKELFSEVLSSKEKEMIDAVKDELWKKYQVAINKDSISSIVTSKSGNNVEIEQPTDSKRLRKPGEATELQLAAETMDVGKIPAKKFSGSILVANGSKKELGIDRVGSTCPCLKVETQEKLLKPGQSTKLNFTYDPESVNDHGKVQRVIFIESTDSIEPRKFVRLNIELTPQ
jgi:parvulin-like peptidyl-prolyl isomerase